MKPAELLLSILLITQIGRTQIDLPSGYTSVEMDASGILRENHKEFDNVTDAINGHKKALHMNGIDTSKTIVNQIKYPNTPLFSFFYKKNNQDNVYITFVTRGTTGFESVFLECDIEYIDLFESDGVMLYFDPKINKRKDHEF